MPEIKHSEGPVKKSKASPRTGLVAKGTGKKSGKPEKKCLRLGQRNTKKKSVSFAPQLDPKLHAKNFDMSKVTNRMHELTNMAKNIIDESDECFIGTWKDFQVLHLNVTKAEYPIVTALIGNMKKSGYVSNPKPSEDDEMPSLNSVQDDALDYEPSVPPVSKKDDIPEDQESTPITEEFEVLTQRLPSQMEPLNMSSDSEKSPVISRKKKSPLKSKLIGSDLDANEPSKMDHQPKAKRPKISASESAPSSPVSPLKFPFGAVAKKLDNSKLSSRPDMNLPGKKPFYYLPVRCHKMNFKLEPQVLIFREHSKMTQQKQKNGLNN